MCSRVQPSGSRPGLGVWLLLSVLAAKGGSDPHGVMGEEEGREAGI